MSWTKIMECVPNFSEGRDLQKIDQIVSCLLYTSDAADEL